MKKGHIPILVGGTGFYIQAVTSMILILRRRSRKIPLTVQSWKNWQKEKVQSIFMKGCKKWIRQVGGYNPCKQCKTCDPCTGILSSEWYAYICSIMKNRKNRQVPYNLAYFVLNDAKRYSL